MNLDSILNQFNKFFPANWINLLAKQTGLVKRSTSRFNGKEFCVLLIQAVNSETELSLSSFCKILYQNSRTAKLRIQSLWERMVNKKAVAFMEEIYAKTWELYTKKVKDDSTAKEVFFKKFTNVLIEDSTIVSLHEKLSSTFKGSGGAASKSSLKIHLIYDYVSKKFKYLKVYKNKEPDSSLAYHVLDVMKAGSLLIRDLGFFVLEAFKKIKELEGYFISRLHPSVNVYLSPKDINPIDLVKYIKTKCRTACGSLTVYLGKEKLQVRLVFYQAPEEVINKRKRKLRRNSQKKRGNKPSERLLRWQEYTFIITNLSKKEVTNEVIGTIYRLRWDIELIYKVWKSHLRLDVLKGTREERIEVFLYTKLIGVLLIGMMCKYLKLLSAKFFSNAEISETKVTKFILNQGLLSKIFSGCIDEKEFLTDKYWIKEFCKQKRSRKTTLERINALESFGMATF